jgi:hypothetical protein
VTTPLVPRKRGRRRVPGKEEIHLEIAALVHHTKQSNERYVKVFGRFHRTGSRTNDTLDYARESVAEQLDIHVATVRRAWRAHKNTAAVLAESMDDPKRVEKLKAKMQEIRASRGIPRGRDIE